MLYSKCRRLLSIVVLLFCHKLATSATFTIPAVEADRFTFRFYREIVCSGVLDNRTHVDPIKTQKGDLVFVMEEVPKGSYVFLESIGRKVMLQTKFFLVEHEDAVTIHVLGDSVYFSGKGAAKFNCASSRNKAFDDRTNPSTIDQQVDRFLEPYRDDLSAYAYSVLRCDLVSKFYQPKMRKKTDGFYAIDTLYWSRSTAAPDLYELNDGLSDTEAHLYSKEYLELIFSKCTANANASNVQSVDSASIRTFYDMVDGNFSGYFKDKLLAKFFMLHLHRRGDYPQLFNSMYAGIADRGIKAAPARFFHHHTPGSSVYRFSLPDSAGNSVSLDDFRGKVVVVDFWFTGCGGCRSLAEAMVQSIHPLFKGNHEVVFLTVSIDRNATTWKNSIKRGDYTHPSSINLYTGGQGEDHEFIRYYGFESYPRMLIVDQQGDLVASDLPVPTVNNVHGTTDRFIDLIKNLLGDS